MATCLRKIYDGIPMAITTPQPNQIWRNVGSQEDAAVLASTEHLVQFAMRGYVFSVPPKFFAKCFYHPMQNQQQSTAMDDLKDVKPPQLSDAAKDFLESLKSGPYPRNAGETKTKPTTGTQRRQAIIEQVAACVCRDRQNTYSDAEDNFAVIADYWNLWLRSQKAPRSKDLTSTDVAMMCALIKVARAAVSPGHLDNWVDLAGYAICGAGIEMKGAEDQVPPTH